MGDIETIDGEFRLLACAWRAARQMTGCTPSTVLIELIDQLLDEWIDATQLAHRAEGHRKVNVIH